MRLVVVVLAILSSWSCSAAPPEKEEDKFSMTHVALLRNISESLDATIQHRKNQHKEILDLSKTQHDQLLKARANLTKELKEDHEKQFAEIQKVGDEQHAEMKILLEQILKNIESTDAFKLGQEHLQLIQKILSALGVYSNNNKQHSGELQQLYKQQHDQLKNLKAEESKVILQDRNRQFQTLKEKSALQEKEIQTMLKEVLSKLDQPENCHVLFQMGIRATGVYLIKPRGIKDSVFVYCDMDFDGGWTVIQRRDFYSTEKMDFRATWATFQAGFGKPLGEFWLGNENIHHLTKDKPYELKIDMKDFSNVTSQAKFTTFQIGPSSDYYRIKIAGGKQGQKDNTFVSINGYFFETPNNLRNCHINWGGWWYYSCNAVGNLNGYHGNNKNYQYITFDGSNPLSYTVMKIKPSST